MNKILATLVTVATLLVVSIAAPSSIEARASRLQMTVYNAADVAEDMVSYEPWNGIPDGASICTRRFISNINFAWGEGDVVLPRCGEDKVFIRITGTITAPRSGNYNFYAISDDGIRLSIGKTLVLDDWEDQPDSNEPPYNADGQFRMLGGRAYAIDLWWYENEGGAVLKLLAGSTETNEKVVPSTWFR